MRSNKTLGNQRLAESDDKSRARRLYQIDVAINWILIGVIALVGYWIIEKDVDTYQTEKTYVRLLNDGVTEEEYAHDQRLQQGIRRNVQYKGMTPNEFFIEKWKWRVPIYLVTIFLPMFVAFRRVLSSDLRKWNWMYFPLVAMSLGYGVYQWGKWKGKW